MKLTKENIAAIEAFLTRFENGATAQSLGEWVQPKRSAQTQLNIGTYALQAFRALGVDIREPRSRLTIFPTEMAEFRAWKDARGKK